MVKFDKVPKYFRQRYLLSDLGLVIPTPEEGNGDSAVYLNAVSNTYSFFHVFYYNVLDFAVVLCIVMYFMVIIPSK